MAWRASEFDNSGTASGILRSRLNETQDRSWTGSCVDGLDGTTLCMSRKQFSSEGNREQRLIVLSVVPFGEVCLGRNHSEDGAKLNRRWMRGVFCRQA